MKYIFFPLILISLTLSACTKGEELKTNTQSTGIVSTEGPQATEATKSTDIDIAVNVGEVATTSVVEVSTETVTPSEIRR